MAANKDYFYTNEFAQICGTTKRTLFYYDEIGLLKPSYVREDGVRFYEAEQSMTFMIIRYLKDLGMELKEIKKYMEYPNSKDLSEILLKQKEMIKKQQEQLEHIQTVINTRLHLLDKENDARPNQVCFEEFPEAYFILSNPIYKDDPVLAHQILYEHLNYCRMHNYGIGHPFAAILDCTHLEMGLSDIYAYYCTRVNHIIKDPHMHIRPAGLYAVAYQYGNYREHQTIYEFMLKKIHAEGYICKGFSYKEAIADEVSSGNPDDYITRIMIGISRGV